MPLAAVRKAGGKGPDCALPQPTGTDRTGPLGRYLLMMLLAAVLSGCVTRDVQLRPGHVRGSSPQLASLPGGCRLGAFDWVDRRHRQELGYLGRHAVHYPQLAEWIEAELRAAVLEDPSMPVLQIELLHAYLESHPSGHSLNLVLRSREPIDADPAAAQLHRGQSTGITWFGSQAELGRYVESAAREAMRELLRGRADCR